MRCVVGQVELAFQREGCIVCIVQTGCTSAYQACQLGLVGRFWLSALPGPLRLSSAVLSIRLLQLAD
jgi:hypothetical protein